VTDVSQATVAVEEPAGEIEHVDVIVIGAGVAGLYQIHALREAGFSVLCFERGSGVGGTWYWNIYPGCAFDTPSEAYGYSFSKELLQEWNWKHRYSRQPDTEEYMNLVADKFDLRRHIRLDASVVAAHWDEEGDYWEIELASGERARGSFLFAAVGQYSKPYIPAIDGLDSFKGVMFHVSRWPREGIDLAGKRVAVFGTGSSAVQLIPEIAPECQQLTVFQRSPNYSLPVDNEPVSPELQQEWKATYDEIFAHVRNGHMTRVEPDPRNGRDVPKEERLAMYEEAWATRRASERVMCLFHDLLSDREILAEYSEFVREKIRARVDDPAVAEKLVPTDILFNAKRVPTETSYYETFNRDNVLLVDLRETPVECFTERGIKTSEREHEFDVIILSTGYDKVTGPVTEIDIRGVEGRSLKAKWDEHGLSTLLGLAISGFPNLFITNLPCLAASTARAELTGDWLTEALLYLRSNGYTRIEATQEAEDAWNKHHQEVGDSMVFGESKNSVITGANIPGKKEVYMLYCATAPAWMARCNEVSGAGYRGFELSRST
jgi:cation diffusion facilitator CzcD-associated flavoprotein CzcO